MTRVVFVASLLGLVSIAGPVAAQSGTSNSRTAIDAARRRADDRVIFGNGSGRPSERRRTYIDANGLECEEHSRIKANGDREYDLKCREQKQNRGRRLGRNDDTCFDRNRDGRCDVDWDTGRTYPATLPDMIGAILFGQGRRTDDVTRWLGTGNYSVRYTDRDRNRRPEVVTWLDAAGALVQQWTDSNGDGRADAVRIYRGGQLARVIGQ